MSAPTEAEVETLRQAWLATYPYSTPRDWAFIDAAYDAYAAARKALDGPST
jgi:hypothetical protein